MQKGTTPKHSKLLLKQSNNDLLMDNSISKKRFDNKQSDHTTLSWSTAVLKFIQMSAASHLNANIVRVLNSEVSGAERPVFISRKQSHILSWLYTGGLGVSNYLSVHLA